MSKPDPTPDSPPRPGHVAEWLIGSQVSTDPIDPLGYTIARNQDGEPLYLCCFVVGPNNIERMATMLDRLKPHQEPVSKLPGEDRH